MRKGQAQLSRQIKQAQKLKQKDCTGTDTKKCAEIRAAAELPEL